MATGRDSLCDGVGHGSQQAAGDCAQTQVADDQQIRADLVGQMQQRRDRRADNSSLFDVVCAGGFGSDPGILEYRISRFAAVHPVTLVPKAVGRPAVSESIGGWWSRPATLFRF